MATLPWLDPEELYFPATHTALHEPNGLLAVGGDLSPERLHLAYQSGIFPWYEEDEPIMWWSPSPRAVLFPDKIHISRSLRKRINRQEFKVTCDQAFDQVTQHCALTPRGGQHGTWITEEMREAYSELHRLGHAHSIETWNNGTLVGGLYGVSIGKMFFGESMFSHQTDASKIAFVALAQNLQRWGYPVIDCQISHPHLQSLGSEEINRSELNDFLERYTVKQGIEDWHSHWQQPINPGLVQPI
ncbi:MAG: leucyl/phenylalanyl-tRNA--protein transferase [Pseudohongiellaceae bacterium]|jgi:leucyl/phenylalanyl-tRNA--protein transferase